MITRLLAVIALALALVVSPAAATVNNSANKTIVAGNGSQTTFAFSFIGVASQYISVIFTDASGNQTTLTQGSGPTQYQISLNAPVQGAIWGLGGIVTYNPSGTPIALGTTLTIVRVLPLTQAITLQNQSSVQTLGKGSEQAIDTAVMQDQQISEQIGRALQMNIANSAPPLPLPPAAQAANLGLCFDGTGNNVIACSLAPAGIISSVMQPVVDAATLAAARAALGIPSSNPGYCVIDGSTFAATIAGIQSAINSVSCNDIYIPAGTYPGTAVLTIARSNLKLHGAGGIASPQGITSGTSASTILSFSCFSPGIGSTAVVVGDGSPPLTYGGIDLSDFEILLPNSCNMNGLRVMGSTPDSGNMVRRVRVTELIGNTVGAAVVLDSLVYSWRFEDVIVDHFFVGYDLVGQNHFTQIVGGAIRSNTNGISSASLNGLQGLVVQNVDIEGNTGFAIDIWATGGTTIRDNFIDNGALSSTIGVRLAAGAAAVEGVIIEGNVFNNGGSANYAIDLEPGGFNGLTIMSNHFNSYGIADILNSAPASNAQKGVMIGNDRFGAAPEATAWTGFYIADAAVNRNFTVSQLPTCNFLMQGARYWVIDQSTPVAYKGAVTGGGSSGQGVACNGAVWYQN